jgi:DNA-binding CsgD family transcriptional regulator
MAALLPANRRQAVIARTGKNGKTSKEVAVTASLLAILFGFEFI